MESDDDEICFIRNHRITKGSIELDVYWTSGRREWGDIDNVRQDGPNIVKKYVDDNSLDLASSKKKRKTNVDNEKYLERREESEYVVA